MASRWSSEKPDVLNFNEELFDTGPLPLVDYFADEMKDEQQHNQWVFDVSQNLESPSAQDNITLCGPIDQIRAYNRARNYRGKIVGAIAMASSVAQNYELLGDYPVTPTTHAVETGPTIHSFLTTDDPHSGHDFPQWFIDDVGTLAGSAHEFYDSQKSIIGRAGHATTLLYAVWAADIQEATRAHVRRYLDENGLSQQTVLDIREGCSLEEGTKQLVQKAEAIIGFPVPARILQHDDSVILNPAENRAHGRCAAARMPSAEFPDFINDVFDSCDSFYLGDYGTMRRLSRRNASTLFAFNAIAITAGNIGPERDARIDSLESYHQELVS